MRPSLPFIVFLAALGSSSVLRLSLATEAATDSCYDRATSQAELHRCADVEARASRRRVDAAYATLQRSASAAELRDIRIDQRAWLAYRKANCASASNVDLPDAGSIAPMLNLQCMTQRNNARVAYLRWRALPLEDRQQRRAMP